MIEVYFMAIRDFIAQPWPWYVAGPLFAMVMFVLLYFGQEFGTAESCRLRWAADGEENMNEFFKIDWRSGEWNLLVALGAVFGGYLASHYFIGSNGDLAHISDVTIASLNEININVTKGAVPLVPEFLSWKALLTWQGLLMIGGGGFLVGFGARYAGGCTSGHAISGLSALQVPSLFAVIGFFMGGLLVINFVIPYLF